MTRINENRLRFLHEAAIQGSMRAASEKLNIAPSSVSRQIAQLEADFGVPLIERGRRHIKLTEAGEMALEYYRERLTQQEAFLSRLQDLRGLRQGTVYLAVGEGFVGDSLSAILDGFLKAHPGMSLTVSIGGTSEVRRAVIEDEAHIGMVFDAPPDPKIRIHTKLHQQLSVIVPAGHPLAEKPSVLLRDLLEYRLCLPPKPFRIRQLIELGEAEEGTFLTPAITTNSLLILKNLVRSGRGITILPEIVASQEIADGHLCAVPIDNRAMSAPTISIITRLGRRLPVGAAIMLRALEAHLPIWTNRQA